MKNELTGFRGTGVYKLLKRVSARTVGRAFWYDHLTAAVDDTMARHRERQRPLTYYEFGTGSGNTLQRAVTALAAYRDSRVFLFDSFEGLPPATNPSDRHVLWHEGDFAYSEEYIRKVLERTGFELSRARFVKGLFGDSLTPALRLELAGQPPAFVTVDVDYYSSTKVVLDFLAPFLASGCTFYFDDLWSFDGHPGYGQLRALSEFNRSHERGQLVPNPIFQNRIYTYHRHEYEFARGGDGDGK